MIGHRLTEAGALTEVPIPVAHPLEWRLSNHHGWFDGADIVLADVTFSAKWAHAYLITGCLGAMAPVFAKAQPRSFYAKVEGTSVWTTPLGAIHDGSPASALVETAVPIFGTWTAPDDRTARLVVGMTRGADQDWELGPGTHNVHVIDLGALVVR